MREDLQKLKIFIWIVRRVLWFFFILLLSLIRIGLPITGWCKLVMSFCLFWTLFSHHSKLSRCFLYFFLQNQTSKQFMFLQVEETVLKFSFPFFLLLEHEFSISYTILFWLLTFCSMKNIAKCTLKYVSSSDSLCLSRSEILSF